MNIKYATCTANERDLHSNDFVFIIAGNTKKAAGDCKSIIPVLYPVGWVDQIVPESDQSVDCIATKCALRYILGSGLTQKHDDIQNRRTDYALQMRD